MLNLVSDFEYVPSEIDIIHDNVSYFKTVTVDLLDSRLDEFLKHTDKAKFFDRLRFTDRFGTAVYWENLSTGGMTILNVLYNPDKCFDVVECGINALMDLVYVPCGWAGEFRPFRMDEKGSCNVRLNVSDDRIYNRIEEFMV